MGRGMFLGDSIVILKEGIIIFLRKEDANVCGGNDPQVDLST